MSEASGSAARRGRDRALGMALAAIAAAVTAVTLAPGAPLAGIASAAPACAPAPGAVPADKRLFFVSDSVGLGARTALPAAFPGWQVTVTGKPAWFVENMVRDYVNPAPAAQFGDIAVVAGGYNYPYWDPARFDRSIDEMIAALRAKCVSHILWVTLREVKPQYITPGAWRQVQPYQWYFPTVNAHLRAALARHPDLTLVDWAAAADQPGLTYDAIHLNTTGAALYSGLIAEAARLVPGRLDAGTVTALDTHTWPGVPAGAAAVALNVTAVAPRIGSYLTVFPCDPDTPGVSNANYATGQTVAAAAIVPVAADGTICVYNDSATHVLVDVTGSFPAGAGLVPVGPTRLVDTRSGGALHPGGTALRIAVSALAGAPSDASAVVLNITATDATAAGFVTAAPCGAAPTGTSNVNYGAGQAVPNVVVVAPGEGGEVCVTASTDAHVIVDVFAVLEPDADAAAVVPQRLYDSRRPGSHRLEAGETATVRVRDVAQVPSNATGAMLNLTASAPAGAGYLSAYPCAAGAPTASNLNTTAGRDVANFVLVSPDASGDVCIYSSVATDVIVDVAGWTGAAFTGVTPTRVLDTRG